MILTDAETKYLLADSNNNKYYLVKLIREKQKDNLLGRAPLIMLDDKIISDSNPDSIIIKKVDIKNIEILEPLQSTRLYGARGRDGFISVRTYGWKKKLP